MSRLDDLLQTLCPDGVEYTQLGKVAEIRSGWGFPLSEQGKSDGEFPFFKVSDMNTPGNEMMMRVANNYIEISTSNNLGCNPAPSGTVIFPKIGAAIGTNKKRILNKLSCYDNNVVGIVPSDKLLSKYFFYLIESVDLLRFANYSGAMPSIRKTTLEKFSIPLPPLPVQEEIVRILDTFTALETELEAELAARVRQYEYYRDGLLNFNESDITAASSPKIRELIQTLCPDGVEYKRMWELTTWDKKFNGISRYKQPSVIKYHYFLANELKNLATEEGNVKLLFTSTSEQGVTTEDKVGKYLCEGEIVAIPWGGNPQVQYYKGKFVTSDNRIATSNDTCRLSNKFLYYWMISKLPIIASFYRGSGIKHPSMAKVLDLKIPVPPLPVQEEIVRILDTFTNVVEVLETELDARVRQYEYYRDKLLTFPQKPPL